MGVTIQLANLRPPLSVGSNPAEDYVLNFMITGTPVTGHPINLNSGLSLHTSTGLDDYINGPNNGIITFDYLDSGRLYIGYGPLPYGTKHDEYTVGEEYRIPNSAGTTVQPVPYWKRYYGVIEFAYVPGDTGLWIDMTNVNLIGLPTCISGYTVFGETFNMGYNGSVETIRQTVEGIIGTTGGCPGANPSNTSDPNYTGIASKITCVTGFNKVVSPTAGNSACWRSFDAYLTALNQYNTPISITSDAPTSGGTPITFTGNFNNVTGSTDNVITLSSSDSTYTLNIELGEFSTANIYACANGKVVFNTKTVPFNMSDDDATAAGFTPGEQIISNSTVRNILIGMNEGRFVPATSAGSSLIDANNNENWGGPGATYGPFPNDAYGNQYAKLVHENINGYGYPYADKYLGALIVANNEQTVTITACAEQGSNTCGFNSNPPSSSSPYSFIIGAGSQGLGNIIIGSSGKSAPIAPDQTTGSYEGEFLASDSWAKMTFLGPDGSWTNRYIYYKLTELSNPRINPLAMTDAHGNQCLQQNGADIPPYTIWWQSGDGPGSAELKMPSNLTWNEAAGPAVLPT